MKAWERMRMPLIGSSDAGPRQKDVIEETYDLINLPTALLALPLKKNPLKNVKGEDSSSGDPALVMKPRKRLRGELVLEELNSLQSRMVEIAAKLVGPNTSS
ncbi:uncharacterized protein A4U43_C01F25580 [Asparagus officinalis]|uniref:Uncharacterized protein n=1 Tax=Asparagus officinalis TaxID=4686 RepID=A0A5P1FS39_ASPOF|nr:uncharacterized protein A4U43_C01F25580 [Asparagus officinalis]